MSNNNRRSPKANRQRSSAPKATSAQTITPNQHTCPVMNPCPVCAPVESLAIVLWDLLMPEALEILNLVRASDGLPPYTDEQIAEALDIHEDARVLLPLIERQLAVSK